MHNKYIEDIEVNVNFKKLALSHYGYDGGNLKADIWFSGLEWGGGMSPDELRKDIAEGVPEGSPSSDDLLYRKRYLKFPFDRKILKILASSLDRSTSEYKNMIAEDIKAYASDGAIFKFNLYPISFKNTSPEFWNEDFFQITGFPTKEQYISWVQLNRFPIFNNLVKENKPKVIVCSGTTFKKDFLMAFGGVASLFQSPKKYPVNGKSDIEVYKSSLISDCYIVVTPFFGGRYGLSKNEECEFVGKLVRKYQSI